MQTRVSRTFVHNPRNGGPSRDMFRVQRKVNRYAEIGEDEDGNPEEVPVSYWDEVTEPVPGTRERRTIYFDSEDEAKAFASQLGSKR